VPRLSSCELSPRYVAEIVSLPPEGAEDGVNVALQVRVFVLADDEQLTVPKAPGPPAENETVRVGSAGFGLSSVTLAVQVVECLTATVLGVQLTVVIVES
jgi:hypothetical protein